MKKPKIINPIISTIWDEYYWIRVPWLQTTSVQYLTTMGVNVTGIKDIDTQNIKQLVTRQATIATMIDFYKEGVLIRLVNYSDLEKIYNSCNNYLRYWVDILEKSINTGDIDLESLIVMDEFCSELFESVKYMSDEVTNSMFENIKKLNPGVTKSGILKRKTRTTVNGSSIAKITNGEFDSKSKQRDNYSDFFKSRITRQL